MRTLIETIDGRFVSIDERSRSLLEKVTDQRLFWSPVSVVDTLMTLSVGGSILRSAALVEQAFLGITRRLWDDPFEWTLPEKLSTKAAIAEYLAEVADTRRKGLGFLTSDSDLSRLLPAPEELKPILAVLLEAIARSEYHLGRGTAVYRLLTSEASPSPK